MISFPGFTRGDGGDLVVVEREEAHVAQAREAVVVDACPSAGDPLGPVELGHVRPRPALGLLEGPTQDGPSTHLLGGEGVSTSVWKALVRCAIRSLSRVFPELHDVSVGSIGTHL